MARHPIYDRLFRPEGMKAARDALLSQDDWFLHQSPKENFESIKANGLVPNDPVYYGYEASPYEIHMFGESYRSIVCFSPIGTKMNVAAPLNDLNVVPPLFCVALHKDHLPC